MRQLRVLRLILKETGALKILAGFAVLFFLCATLIRIREPEVGTWFDACWYCFAVVTTVGFGDITVHTFLSRILTVLLSVYAVLVIAIITGVVVNFYMEMVNLRQKDTIASFKEKLENLPDLSKEELAELSAKIRAMESGVRKKKRKS